MLRSLRARLLGSMLLVTAAVVGGSLLVADPLVEERATAEAEAALDAIARSALAELERGADPRELADRLAAEHAARLAFFGADDAPLSGAEAGGRAGVAELSRVRRHGRASEVRADEAGRAWMYVWRAGADGRVARAARPIPEVLAARSTVRQVLLVAGLVALVMSALLAEHLARAIGDPIRDMTRATDALRRGELTARVRSRRQDELGELGGAIDRMAERLADRIDAAHREEGRLRTIIGAMVEGVFVTDREGRIVLTNAAFAQLAGGAAEGRTAVEAIRSPELHEAVQRALAGEARDVTLELTAGGTTRALTAHVAPLPEQQGVVAVLHDVTELKRADAVRRDFVANASHELRTPLTSIRGFAETLLDGALADERTAARFVRNIAENARRLEELVRDLLELSRAESPESAFELGPVDACEVAVEVLRGVERRAAEKRLLLSAEGVARPAIARGERRALEQVLLNLVDNAIKYTPEGGLVRVRVARRGDRVVLEVCDNGPGIPRAHLDRIFERFYRVDRGRARAQGGTGLGLSIVKHLVGRMEGEVEVESRVGEGSTFRVSLAAADTDGVA